MKTIIIRLNRELYEELCVAADDATQFDETPCLPEDFAKEAVESVLASRRLERRTLERLGIAS